MSPDSVILVAGRRVAALALAALALLGAACTDDASGPGVVPDPLPDSTASWPVARAIPVLRISTTNSVPVASKDVYVNGSVGIFDTLAGSSPLELTTEVKGHGNSTWFVHPKKPYRLKLASAAPLLGMPASRHWVLLANHSDKTLIRNDVVLELGRRMGWAWVPRTQFVDVYLNGQYQGVYQLAEHVRVASERVNVPELRVSDTSAAAITGGYLLEIDETRGEPFCFDPARLGKPICAKSPETLTDSAWRRQRDYIVSYVAQLEAALYGPGFADPNTGYAAYIDVASAVDYYLLEELVKNVDSNLRRGTYITKPRGGKFYFGPLWDFDLAIGNVDYDGAGLIAGWHTRQGAWYQRLFQDPAFDARVRARWRQLRADGTIEGMVNVMARRGRLLSTAASSNFSRWPILGTYVWPNRVVTGTYPEELRAMQEWYLARMRWMDAQLGY